MPAESDNPDGLFKRGNGSNYSDLPVTQRGSLTHQTNVISVSAMNISHVEETRFLDLPGGRLASRGAMQGRRECFDRVAELGCPVLVVMGSRDPDFADPAAEAAYAQEPIGAHARTDIAMVDGAGHYPHGELPDVTASAVLLFLAAAINA